MPSAFVVAALVALSRFSQFAHTLLLLFFATFSFYSGNGDGDGDYDDDGALVD